MNSALKQLVLLSALLLPCAPAFAGEIKLEGDWLGTLNVGVAKLRLLVHIKKTKTGYSATMDSLDQGAKGIPISSVALKGRQVILQVKAVRGTYKGRLSDDGQSIDGIWNQGKPLKLLLKRVKEGFDLSPKRPQTPKGPFPYTPTQVDFGHKPGAGVEASFEPHRNTAKGRVNLSGTLTLPKGKGPFPAVVLVSGSGPQDRDESLMSHKPFWVLADALSRQGIAVLRYDDRGVAKSTGSFRGATTQDFADDAQAAVLYLRTRKDIDKGRIGLCGHSEGGVIAPIVATRTDAVGFIVLLAGTGVDGLEIIKLQSRLIQRANGVPEAQVKDNSRDQAVLLGIAAEDILLEAKRKKLTAALKGMIAKASPAEKAQLGDPQVFIQSQLRQVMSPWFQYFLKHDPAKVLGKVRCPVLALNGEKDLQVDARQNFPPMMKALEKGGNKDYMFIKLPGLNHLFQRCKTGSPTEYSRIEETFSEEATQWVSSWVLKREAWKPAQDLKTKTKARLY